MDKLLKNKLDAVGLFGFDRDIDFYRLHIVDDGETQKPVKITNANKAFSGLRLAPALA